MNKIIRSVSSLLGDAEVEGIVRQGREFSAVEGCLVIERGGTTRSVYYLKEGIVVMGVEDRYRVLVKKVRNEAAGVAEGEKSEASLQDIVLAPEIESNIYFGPGSFLLAEYSLYESTVTFSLKCRTQCKLVEIDAGLFKSLTYGNTPFSNL